MQSKRFYRVPELSRGTGIARASLYVAIRRGEIESVRLGTAHYIPASEVRRLRLLGEEPTEDSEPTDHSCEQKTAAAIG